jgi:hypothetical protein
MKNTEKQISDREVVEKLLKAVHGVIRKGRDLDIKERESTLDGKNKETVKEIVSDLKDPDKVANVSDDKIPAEKDSVLMQKTKKERGLAKFVAFRASKKAKKKA